MTVSDFNIYIKNKTKSEKISDWISCGLVTVICTFLVIYINTTLDKLGNKIPLSVTLIISCLLVICLISIYQLLSKYRITTITNNQSIEDKSSAIISAFSRLPVTLKNEDGRRFNFVYQKNRMSIAYEIDLVYDEIQVCFVVIGRGYMNGGLIDFGNATKLRNIIANELNISLC